MDEVNIVTEHIITSSMVNMGSYEVEIASCTCGGEIDYGVDGGPSDEARCVRSGVTKKF